MRFAAALALVVLAAGCAGTSSGGTTSVAKSDGCFRAEEALSAFQDFADGLSNKTLTLSDMEADLKKVAGKLDDAAALGPAQVTSVAGPAAVDAGQLRVALAGGDDPSVVSAKAGDLRSKMDALGATCG